jgi:hypothetical protein
MSVEARLRQRETYTTELRKQIDLFVMKYRIYLDSNKGKHSPKTFISTIVKDEDMKNNIKEMIRLCVENMKFVNKNYQKESEEGFIGQCKYTVTGFLGNHLVALFMKNGKDIEASIEESAKIIAAFMDDPMIVNQTMLITRPESFKVQKRTVRSPMPPSTPSQSSERKKAVSMKLK